MPKSNPKSIKSDRVRVRMAPSPTGFLHLGSARTTLFNFLFARKHKGNFILRIEDTDIERNDIKYEKDIIESLKWLGLGWDEGPIENQGAEDKGGYGPYRQSQRKDIYKKYIKQLLDEEKAYFCFCSREDLEAQKQYLMSIGQPPRYSGKCRNLPPETIKKLLAEGKSSIIRIKMPSKKVVFTDLIRGKVEFDSSLFGDVSIAKDENTPLYNLAVVIDDFEMKITHVIRGEEHISNTPKQILIQEALDFPSPQYAHLPLILGPDKSKLSKRHGATSISEYRKEGYLPEALVNIMALLGWNPGTEREIYSLASLIKDFSLERCQKGGAVFNTRRLDWINGFYIRQRSEEKLADLCIPYLIEAGFIEETKNNSSNPGNPGNPEELKLFEDKKRKFKIKETKEIVDIDWIEKVVAIYKERLKKLSEIIELTDFFFKDKIKYQKDILSWKEMSDKEIEDSLDRLEKILSKIDVNEFTKENIDKGVMPEAEKTKDRGRLLWPFRVALSGKEASAGPFEIAEILGKEKTLERIKEAKELLK